MYLTLGGSASWIALMSCLSLPLSFLLSFLPGTWVGLEIDKRYIAVTTENFETSTSGVFAVGDVNTYPGKKKLILSGFHEAALAAYGIQQRLFPGQKQFVQYTTTSPIMHKRLGLEDRKAS